MSTSAMQSTKPLLPKDADISSGGFVKLENGMGESFPAGLRVLVVDDDPICLLILDRMLRRCLYQVTTCSRAIEALKLLRENRNGFDVVISDVIMPDMDGFKLLELVGLEMDLPVIMMSANGETSAVMKGVKHGACDYLLKPVRMEELRNIWQHVVRKKCRVERHEASHDDGRSRLTAEGGDCTSPANDALDGALRHAKKRDNKEEDDEPDAENEDSSTTKKPRVVWTVDLHQQFVNAVNQLGIDKAVPKRILELMNVQGLTRENVASHLQKYRLFLKRLNGVDHHPGGTNSAFTGTRESNLGLMGATGLGGLGTLAGSSHFSPQALMSTLQTGLFGKLGQPPPNLGLGAVDQSLLLQIALLQHQGHNDSLPQKSFGQSGQVNLHDQTQFPVSQQEQLGAFAGSLDRGAMGIPSVPHLASVSSIEQLASNTNPLFLQAVKQQASQSCGGGRVNLPGSMPGISHDINGWGTTSVSSVSGATYLEGSSVVVSSSPPINSLCSSNLLLSHVGEGIGNMGFNACNVSVSQPCPPNISPVDLKGLTVASTCNVHSPLSLVTKMDGIQPISLTIASLNSVGLSDLGARNVHSPLSLASEMSPQSMDGVASKYTYMSHLAIHGQGHQADHIHHLRSGLGLSPPVSGSVLSPGLSQVSATSHGMKKLAGGPEGGLAHIMTPVNSSTSTIKQSYQTQDLKGGLPVDIKRDQASLAEPCSTTRGAKCYGK